jgi:hypothetical protein
VITVTMGIPGYNVLITSTNASGDLDGSEATVTAAVKNTTLVSGGAKAALKAMYQAMSPELRAWMSSGKLRYIVTQSIYDNYLSTLEDTYTAIPEGFRMVVDGVPRLTYRGIPLIVREDWDIWINSADFGYVRPHRALLTVPENLVVGTDGSGDDTKIETWYNVDLQKNRTRVEYKVGTQFVHQLYIVAAY